MFALDLAPVTTTSGDVTLHELLPSHPAACMGAAVFLGLVAGSFLNVVVFRLPRILEREWQWEIAQRSDDSQALKDASDERFSLAFPRSHCPACGTSIRPLDNVPVFGFLRLRGRCRACGVRIPLRYPAVEIASALAAVAVAWHFECGAPMAGALLLTFALIALACIDLEKRLLPDAITLPFLWLGLAINLFGVYAPLPSAVIGAIAGYGVLWSVFQIFRLITGKEGMGHGDFKLLAMVGAWLGWETLSLVILLSSATALIIGGTLIALGYQKRHSPMPFGPFLAAAAWLCLLFGDVLGRSYLVWVAGLA